MIITIEKTFTGKLSRSLINNIAEVYITHLPNTSLERVAEEADNINQYAGKNIAVPHCAVRNIGTTAELTNFITQCQKKHLNKILIIGGANQNGKAFQSVDELLIYKNNVYNSLPNFKFECGIYPQKESFIQIHEKLHSTKFVGGITQLCMDTNLLHRVGNKFGKSVKIGIPSMCSMSGLWRYLKLCGNKSPQYMLDNWKGLFYLKDGEFNVTKFISQVNHSHYHIYNFGKLEKTVDTLMA
jgi:hypothetical protein